MPSQGKRRRSSSESSSSPNENTKGNKSNSDTIFRNDKFFIVEVNITRGGSSIPQLTELIESNGGAITDVRSCNIVLTTIRSSARLELHLPYNLLHPYSKNYKPQPVDILNPGWVIESVKSNKRLEMTPYIMIQPKFPGETNSNSNSPIPNIPQTSQQHCFVSSSQNELIEPDHTRPDKPKFDPSVTLSCRRLSPLVSANEDLVTRLAIIAKARKLEGDERGFLSYSKAIASIKSVPHKLKTGEAAILGQVGAKIANMVEEYLCTGQIREADITEHSERFKILSQFTTVYTVGPHRARELYNAGCKTLADISKEPHNVNIQYVEDFKVKIPRAEVMKIAQEINKYVQRLLDGTVYTICGGFRRGKPESNDIDIVFSHPQRDTTNLLTTLISNLQEDGIIKQTIHTVRADSHRPSEHGAIKRSHFEDLDICLCVIEWLTQEKKKTHRRLDIIITNYKHYWTAVVGWTGSTQFERDIRLAAQKKGFKFDSRGITRQKDGKDLEVSSEEEVFNLLGLEWIPPTFRNADV